MRQQLGVKMKEDLLFSVKNELNIDNESSILPLSDLNNVEVNISSIEAQTEKIDKRKKRESLGSVNLKMREQKYESQIKNGR